MCQWSELKGMTLQISICLQLEILKHASTKLHTKSSVRDISNPCSKFLQTQNYHLINQNCDAKAVQVSILEVQGTCGERRARRVAMPCQKDTIQPCFAAPLTVAPKIELFCGQSVSDFWGHVVLWKGTLDKCVSKGLHLQVPTDAGKAPHVRGWREIQLRRIDRSHADQ